MKTVWYGKRKGSRVARLRVPERDRPAVIELTRLTEDQLKSLNEAITNARASRAQTLASLQTFVALPGEALTALVAMTASRLAHDMSSSELSEMLVETLGDELGPTKLDTLLENASILRMAKQLDLFTAFERALHTFRVVTDIRPVFDEEVSSGINAALVTHTLQISFAEDNQFKEVFIAADMSDLQAIRGQIDRAIEKSAEAEKFIEKAKATVLAGDDSE